MEKWEEFFKKNDGNNFSHTSLISFFYRHIYKIKKNKLLNLFKLCNLRKVDYNFYYYTENNSKDYIKFNVITGQK